MDAKEARVHERHKLTLELQRSQMDAQHRNETHQQSMMLERERTNGN